MPKPFALAVTSFSDAGYEEYGKRFIETYCEHWKNISLLVFLEGERLLESVVNGPIIGADLTKSTDLAEFKKAAPKAGNYRWDAGKFAAKVFAVTDPRVLKTTTQWLLWLDADIVTEKPVDAAWLRTVLKGDIAYLGRDDWHHSECGFVGYRMNARGRQFLARFREVYTSGEVYEHMEWHDSYIFDRVREEFPPEWFHNISAGVKGLHVFDDCPLGERLKHLKGPMRKKGVKGAAPDGYWSAKETAA